MPDISFAGRRYQTTPLSINNNGYSVLLFAIFFLFIVIVFFEVDLVDPFNTLDLEENHVSEAGWDQKSNGEEL